MSSFTKDLPRGGLVSTPSDDGAVCRPAARAMDRRAVLGVMAVCGGAAALGCGCSAKALAEEAAGGEAAMVMAGDQFARVVDGAAPVALRLDDLKPGAAVMDVLPLDPATGKLRDGSRMNAINLVRIANVESGSPLEATKGVAAYSAICTHKACKVTSFEAQQNRWRCFCHMSEFDVLANGEVLDGPATQPLPRIPIAIGADGIITATAGFTSAPGASG
ncbi:MAG: ubiquinol-cytochrome c reductase iron-sulfur subunit [Hyphomicrobium sp.]